jgi:hypothetical protein
MASGVESGYFGRGYNYCLDGDKFGFDCGYWSRWRRRGGRNTCYIKLLGYSGRYDNRRSVSRNSYWRSRRWVMGGKGSRFV